MKDLINLLVISEHYGVSNKVDRAMGLYKLPYTWKEIWKKLKRILKSK
jgi:hypothetical protein